MKPAPPCDLCGTPDPLDLGTCVSCAGGGSVLLFLEPPARRSARGALSRWLEEAVGSPARSEDLRDAIAGMKPLVALTPPAARRAVNALAGRGIPSGAIARASAWGRLPAGFALWLAAVLGVGLATGLRAEPRWLVVTPLFVGLLALIALRRARTPLLAPRAAPVLGLPPGAERKVRRAIADLPPGRARRLLTDIARLAAALHADDAGHGAGGAAGELPELIPQLLHVSSDAALDLQQLEECLSVLDAEPPAGVDETAAREAVGRARAARDSLVARLGETVAGLGRARAATVEPPDDLHALLSRLEEDVARRAAARREVEELLHPDGGELVGGPTEA